jgi:hypothetical protein
MAGQVGFAVGVFRFKHPQMMAVAIPAGVALVMLVAGPSVSVLERLDLRLFEMLSGHVSEVVGQGTRGEPREIEVIGIPGEAKALEVLFLDDEPSGYFEQMPPPPADVMVVMDRLRERGAKAVAVGYPLQWEEPDTLAVEAMRRVMDQSDATVLGFPLKDSTAPAPVATPFQRASAAYADVEGDGTKLPVVSNIRGLAPEMGGSRCLAGFTRLETEEPDEERAYLLARWSDRVVFALPVALEIARRGLDFEDVSIHMGRDIRLGADGPRIPIDFRGRVALPAATPERSAQPATAVIAESLPDGFAVGDAPLYLTDERLLGAKADREWASALGRIDAAVRGAPRRLETWPVPRPFLLVEFLGIGLLGFGLAKTLRPGEIKTQLLRLAGWLLGISLLLALLIRLVHSGPMPLAFLSLPLTAMLVIGCSHFAGRVKVAVVDSEALGKPIPAGEAAASKRAKKRRKKGR